MSGRGLPAGDGRQRGRRAFSLIELLAVLLAVAVAAALAAPDVLRLLRGSALRSAAAGTCAQVARARLSAVTRGQPLLLAWRQDALALLDGQERILASIGLPDGVTASAAGGGAPPMLRFLPDGSAQDARWRLHGADGGVLVVAIDGPTGAARVEEGR